MAKRAGKANQGLWVLAAVVAVAWAVVWQPITADAAPSRRSSVRQASRTRPPSRGEVRHSVVVIGAKPDAGREQRGPRSPLALGAPVDDTERLLRAPNLRCDVCAATAADAQPGRPSIFVLDLRSITNRLTTMQFSGATLKLTSFSPIGLQFRKPF